MKQYIKLFEDFITEEDPLAFLNKDKEKSDNKDKSDDSDKKDKSKSDEEDPFKKEKKAIKKKKEEEEEKIDKKVSKRKASIEEILDDHPEIDKKLGDKIIAAVNSKDRVKIHNAFNDLMALQIKYQENGDTSKVNQIAKLKDEIDDLDYSYTNNKLI
ncbi:MAG: hypothetical protein RLZZ479_1568 [Bacteroidota bacterium]|jgi:flagellar biosynthesis GTPase FlhF